MLFRPLMLILALLVLSITGQAKERISLDFSYNGSALMKADGKGVVESGQTILKEFGRGDIDTVIAMTPRLEGNPKDKSIHIDISVKNFRDGDLISESTPQVVATPGKQSTLSLTDETLNEEFKISLTAKTLQ